MAENQITPFQLTDQFTMDTFNQRINETNIALQKKADTSVIEQIENDVNVLESRMNEFTSLPQGSTSGDAELADIRVGQDGTVYGTAGNAVRAQVNQLKQDLTGLQTVVDSKADKTDLAKTNLYLDALYKLNKGQTYDVLEQESEAYSVDVPSGAKYVGIDKVGGKSVVWNQLWNYEETEKEAGITYTYENHFYDVIKNTTEKNGLTVRYNVKSNNKYYVSFEASSNDNIKLVFSFNASLVVELTESNKRYRGIIKTGTLTTPRSYIYLYSPSGVTCSYRVGNIKVIDLTQMFGAGNEPSTVEEFEAMFPADYYPYSDPTIISSQTDRVDVASADGTISQQITTGFPVLNSAGSVYDYIDLNEGKLHQRVGVMDLGTINWGKGGSNNRTSWVPSSWRTNVKPAQSPEVKANILCNKYYTDIAVRAERQVNDKTISVNDRSWVYIYDSAYISVTPQEFKTAMSGVMLYYELAEEIITDITIPTELTDWLTVEAGCSVTFHNADDGKRLLVPNKLSFVRKLDEVTV